MANQLASQATKIVLVGEFGLAAVSALLNKPVCKIESSYTQLNYLDYRRFFKKFFQHAEECGCHIVFPVDFVTGDFINKDDCVTDTERARA